MRIKRLKMFKQHLDRQHCFSYYFLLLFVVSSAYAGEQHTVNTSAKANNRGLEKYQWLGKLDDVNRKIGLWVYKSKSGKIKKTITFRTGVRHGPSIAYYDNGQIFIEQRFDNGLLSGPYREFYENGQLQLEKHYYKDLLQGRYTRYYKSGRKKIQKNYERDILHGIYVSYVDKPSSPISEKGKYALGRKVGLWQKWSSTGAPVREEHFINGLRHGICRYYVFGNLYLEQQYRRDVLHGKSLEYFLTPERRIHVEGYYDQGLSTGLWTYWRVSGSNKYKTVQYKKGLQHGPKTEFDDKGRIWKIVEYANGLLHGKTIEYHIGHEGSIYLRGKHKNDKKTGLWRYYRHGMKKPIKVLRYKNNMLNGESRYFYESGRLRISEVYENDVLHGLFQGFFDNKTNSLIETGQYIKGKRSGTWYSYYSVNKKQREVIQYKLGKKHGRYLKYYPSGNIWIKANYLHGKLEGEFKRYYDSKQPLKRITGFYSSGKKTGYWVSWSYAQTVTNKTQYSK